MYKCLFFYCALLLLSCEKDKIAFNDAAQIAVVHASGSMGEVELAIGSNNTLSLKFQEVSGSADNIYNGVNIGIQTCKIENAAGDFLVNSLSYFSPNTKNTIFLYDTVSPQQERKPALVQLADPVRSSADSGWVRFVHLATGIDSVSVQLLNDTDTLVIAQDWRQPAFFNNPKALEQFRGPLKAGIYRMQFFDKDKVFFYEVYDVLIKGGKSETIFSYGPYNPVAQHRFAINSVLNN